MLTKGVGDDVIDAREEKERKEKEHHGGNRLVDLLPLFVDH